MNYHCYMNAEADIEASSPEEAVRKFRESLDYKRIECFEEEYEPVDQPGENA